MNESARMTPWFMNGKQEPHGKGEIIGLVHCPKAYRQGVDSRTYS